MDWSKKFHGALKSSRGFQRTLENPEYSIEIRKNSYSEGFQGILKDFIGFCWIPGDS